MDRIVGIALLWTLLAILFAGCSSTPTSTHIPSLPLAGHPEPEPTPVGEPPSRSGNPESYEVFGKRYHVLSSSEGFRQTGIASWYGADFHGKKTSSGPPFDMYAVTAAHKQLPIPTYVRVTHLVNGRSIVVKVNDRGPFIGDRIIDLSYGAAVKLGMVEDGTAPVEVTALPPYQYLASTSGSRPEEMLAAAEEPKGTSKPPTEAIPNKPAPYLTQTPKLAAHTPAAAPPQPLRANDQFSFSAAAKPPATLIRTANQKSQGMPTTASSKAPRPRLYLQVGAFSEPNHARQLQRQLASRLKQAIIIDSSPGKLHRVRIGPFHSSDEAFEFAVKLTNLGIKAHPVTL
jgi:rare lipoprotein A